MRPNTNEARNKLQAEEEFLHQTFMLWGEKPPTDNEDAKFILSMKTDRKASIGPRDKKFSQQVKRKQDRCIAENKRREAAKLEMKQQCVVLSGSDSNVSDEDEVQEFKRASSWPSTSKNYEKLDFCNKKVNTGTNVHIPHDIISNPKLVSIAVRYNITPTQQAAYTATLIKEAGGDVTKVATSYAAADKARRKVASHISTKVKGTWEFPEYASVHWDSKLAPSLNDPNVKEKRLCI